MKRIEFFEKNDKLLADGTGYRMPAVKNEVNLNWWHMKYNHTEQNLGDMLSEVIYNFMCNKYGLDVHTKLKKTCHFYAVGSILFFENQDAVVWGTGCTKESEKNINNIIHQKYMRKLDVRAVRGPKTKEALDKLGIKCPEVYGDPAMLMPLIYQPVDKKTDITVVITHLKDEKEMCDRYASDIVITDMVTDDWKKKIDMIVSAKRVISSSLHGLILAESYGVPAVLLRPKTENSLFKYEDYYLGTGRNNIPIVNSIEEGMQYDMKNYSFPSMETIQNRLIESFPKDIWDNKK